MKNNKSKKKLKSVIDCYKQPIYVPETLYIIKNTTKEQIDKLFEWKDDKSSIIEGNEDKYDAITFGFPYSKKDKKTCVVVVIHDNLVKEKDKLYQINVCAHEALHAAQDILEYCNITLNRETSETYAFMVGWVTQCMYETLMKK